MYRKRQSQAYRDFFAESVLRMEDLIYPLFIEEGKDIKREIGSMEGICRFSPDRVLEEVGELVDLGVNSFILFGIPASKDWKASSSYDEDGVIQSGARLIKEAYPQAFLIGDVCMCEYTDHGHCGILDGSMIDMEETRGVLAKIGLSYAESGIDLLAPSGMTQGAVAAIRQALDSGGYGNVPVISYAAKYASNLYGPFREAAGSAPSFGDRKTYQMDYRNGHEAMEEVAQDLREGADGIIVKPSMYYGDILYRTAQAFDTLILAYQVSGEYSMIKNGVRDGLLNQDSIFESLYSLKRAGADKIITYFAKELAEDLKGKI